MSRSGLRLAMAAALLAVATRASATITVVSHYRLGEADTGAADSATGANPTIDSVGGFNLARTGAPAYSSNVPLQTSTPSTLSMRFNGTADLYGAAGVPTTVTDNFGIEAWVRSNGSTTGNALIAYVGNTGNSGWGIFRTGGSYAMLYGGVLLLAGGPPMTTEWTHLALVRDAGVTRFYVNGTLSLTIFGAPVVPAGNMMIGGNLLNGNEYFDGQIDEVRVFTFAPGAFTKSDLNFIPLNIPAVSPLGLASLIALIAIAGVFALSRMS